MTTILDKELKRQITIDGADYTVTLDAGGFRIKGKSKRNPEVELRWRDLLNGDAAMAKALNASLTKQPSHRAATDAMSGPASKRPVTPAKRQARSRPR